MGERGLDRSLWLLPLVLAALLSLALRILATPRPIDLATVPDAILALRGQIAVAGLLAGAGLAIAAVGAQAQARDARIDASLSGPLWGALPAILAPIPVWGQALGAVAGAWLVARITGRGHGGLPMVLTRGTAIAGLVVSLAALILFLGPGLTATTALAFLHASLGGALPSITPDRLLVGLVLLAGAGLLATVGWRQMLLARTGLVGPGHRVTGVVALASAGSALIAGVVPGLGLLAVAATRRLVGEHPRTLIPGAALAGGALFLLLDGAGQALAWPGELPVGVTTALLASGYLTMAVVRS